MEHTTTIAPSPAVADRIAKLEASIASNEAANRRRLDQDELGLSYAASGLASQKARKEIDLLRAGGVARFERPVLETVDGERVEDAKLITTRYGLRWRSDRHDVWLPFRPVRESTLAKKGFREATEELQSADWEIDYDAPSSARGSAGMMQVSVKCFAVVDGKRDRRWAYCGPVSQEPEVELTQCSCCGVPKDDVVDGQCEECAVAALDAYEASTWEDGLPGAEPGLDDYDTRPADGLDPWGR